MEVELGWREGSARGKKSPTNAHDLPFGSDFELFVFTGNEIGFCELSDSKPPNSFRQGSSKWVLHEMKKFQEFMG